MSGLEKFKNFIKIKAVLILIASFFVTVEAWALTPTEVFNKGKDKLNSAATVSANFTMSMNGKSLSGKILAKGNKFAITSNASSNWYNGKDLYTYVPSKNETTVFNPTSSELAEVNPLMYLKTAGNYKIAGTKTKKAGVETVVLIPKSKGGSVKSVTIELDSKTYLPKNMKILQSSGGAIELSISGIKLNSTISDASFNYPKSTYPKAKIVDMR